MYTPTFTERRAFNEAIANDDLLDIAMNWISDNMDPEEVFSEDELSDWACNNGYVKEE